jgi:hypothetical protein
VAVPIIGEWRRPTDPGRGKHHRRGAGRSGIARASRASPWK